MTVDDPSVAGRESIDHGNPSQLNVGNLFLFQLPNDFPLRIHFDHAMSVAGTDQRVAIA